MSEQDVMRLIENVSESLQAEMRVGFQRMETRLDRIENRMDRIGGLVNGGARAISRLATWSENVDQMLAERDRKIDDLVSRVEKLEKR